MSDLKQVLAFSSRKELEDKLEDVRADERDGRSRPAPGKVPRTLTAYPQTPRGEDQARDDDVGLLVREAVASSGQPLPPTLLANLERALQRDLSAVRIHTGAESARAAAALSARAFTDGRDVHFAAGGFEPESRAGQQVIAHEVAHTVQTGGAAADLRSDVDVSAPHEPHEAAAHAFARDFAARGAMASPRQSLGSAAPGIHRLAEGEAAAADSTAGAAQPAAAGDGEQRDWSQVHIPEPAAPPPLPAAATAGDAAAGPQQPQGQGPEGQGQQGQQGPQGQQDAAEPAGGAGPAQNDGDSAPAPSPAPTGGGGGGGDADTQPAGTPQTAGTLREPDGLVDYYMETHWDNTEFWSLIGQHGYPNSAPDGVISETDRWLPPDTDPDTRATINMVAGIAGGALDGIFSVCGMFPVIGAPIIIYNGIQEAVTAVADYYEVGDPLGGTLAVARAGLHMVTGLVDNVALTASLVEMTSTGAGAAALATVVGAPAAAALAPVIAGAKTVKEIAQGVSTGLNVYKVFVDGALLLNNSINAYDAEQSGDFERAGKLKSLMQGNAVDMLCDGIAAIASGVSFVTGVFSPGIESALGVTAKTVATIGKVAPPALGAVKFGAGRLEGVGNDAFQNVGIPGVVSLADEMRVNPDSTLGGDFIERRSGGGPIENMLGVGGGSQAMGIIEAARNQTTSAMDADQAALSGAAPQWYQKLINEILSPSDDLSIRDVAEGMKPSSMVRSAASGIRGLIGWMGTGGADAAATGLDALAGFCEGAGNAGIQALNNLVITYRPNLIQVMNGLDQRIADMEQSLNGIQTAISTVRGYVDTVNQFAAQGGAVDQGAMRIITTLQGLRVTRSTFDIPSLVPDFLVTRALNLINTPVNSVITVATLLKNTAVQQIQNAVVGMSGWLSGKLAQYEAAATEGSTVRDTIRQEADNMRANIQTASQAIQGWEGIHARINMQGAGQWLRDTAAVQRAAQLADQDPQTDPWPGIMTGTAQPAVNDWRNTHSDQVRSQFFPQMPAHEFAACTSVHGMFRPRARMGTDVLLDAAYDSCMSYQGQEGRSALYGLWSAESRLIMACNLVQTTGRPAAPGAGAGAGAGGAGAPTPGASDATGQGGGDDAPATQ